MDNRNKTATNETVASSNTIDVMEIIQLSIAPVGIVANLTVIIVFLSNKKLRRKIPNKLIVNQVKLYFIFQGNSLVFLVFKFQFKALRFHVSSRRCRYSHFNGLFQQWIISFSNGNNVEFVLSITLLHLRSL